MGWYCLILCILAATLSFTYAVAIVTLTSDFGTKNYLAGAFKGRLLQQHPGCSLVDITHDIPPFNFSEAAYIITNSVSHFPDHSFHLLLVNLFDTVTSLPVLAYHKGRYYGVPDNGLLPMVLGEQPDLAIMLPISAKQQYNSLAWADLFGKAIHHIEGGLALDSLGRQADMLLEKMKLQANYTDDYIDGRIIFIDRFENVIVNITREDFDRIGRGREFTLMFKSRDSITRISDGYPQVSEGSYLAFFNA
ncbi:MAG TPA: SAM-dependent chlorinase/fluorinase, partial [Anaerolineae bacterium]|nr:SAM-dependent chlorinase/fluorinase [Anaerolineae bacterium]